MRIKITTDARNPQGKVADAELLFTSGPLAGLKLIGFGIWTRRTGQSFNVTFPARQYSVNGERRSFALLRPNFGGNPTEEAAGTAAQDRLRDLVIAAYQRHAEQGDDASTHDVHDGPDGFTLTTPGTVSRNFPIALTPEQQEQHRHIDAMLPLSQ